MRKGEDRQRVHKGDAALFCPSSGSVAGWSLMTRGSIPGVTELSGHSPSPFLGTALLMSHLPDKGPAQTLAFTGCGICRLWHLQAVAFAG